MPIPNEWEMVSIYDHITAADSEPTSIVAPTQVVPRTRLAGRSPQETETSTESTTKPFTTPRPIFIPATPNPSAGKPNRQLTTLKEGQENERLVPSGILASYVVGSILGIFLIVFAGYLILRGKKHGWKKMFPCCIIGGDPRKKKRKQKEKEQAQMDLEAASLNRPSSTLGKYKNKGKNKDEFEMSEKTRSGGGSMDSNPFASTNSRSDYGGGGSALPVFVPGQTQAGGGNDWENLPDLPDMESNGKGKAAMKGGYEALPAFVPGQDAPPSPPRVTVRDENALPAFIPGQTNPAGEYGSLPPFSTASGPKPTSQIGILPEFVTTSPGSRDAPFIAATKRVGGSELARPPQRKRRPAKEGPRDPYDIDDLLDDDNYNDEDIEAFEDSVVGKPGPSGAKTSNDDAVDFGKFAGKALPTPTFSPPPPQPSASLPPPTVAVQSPTSPGGNLDRTTSPILPPKAPFLNTELRRPSAASSLITSRASYNENPFNPPEIPPPFVPPKDNLDRKTSRRTHIAKNQSVTSFTSVDSDITESNVSFSTGVGRARSNSGNSNISSVRISPVPPSLPEIPHMPDLASSRYFQRQQSVKRTIGTRTPPPPPQAAPAQRVIYSDQKDYEAIPIAMPDVPELAGASPPNRSRSLHRTKFGGDRSRSSSQGSASGPSGPLLPIPNAAPLPPPPDGVFEMPDSMPYTPQYYFSPSQKYGPAGPPPPQPYPYKYPAPPAIPSSHGQAKRKPSPSMITDRQSVFSSTQDNLASQQDQLPTFHQHNRSLSQIQQTRHSTFQQDPLPELLHTPPIQQQELQPSPFSQASSAKEDELARYAARKRERMAKLRGIDETPSPHTHRAQTFPPEPHQTLDPFQGEPQPPLPRRGTEYASGQHSWGSSAGGRHNDGGVAREWNEGW